MTSADRVAQVSAEFIRRKLASGPEEHTIEPMESPLWKSVHATGSELWLDTGDMGAARELWNTSFSALTTNNTLLNKEIQKGVYDTLVADAAGTLRSEVPSLDDQQVLLEIAFILNAYHGLRLARMFDANVSVELHTALAHDVDRSIVYARRYRELSPDRFIVKLPLTPAGLVAVRRLSASGIPVNFTLGFSARQNYLAALFSRPRYVNVFMGRLNAFVSASAVGNGENVGEKTTLATQRYVRKLRTEGRTSSKLIGASIRSGAQLAAVVGTDVLTMPPKAAGQYRDAAPSEVRSRVDDDPVVATAKGHSIEEFNGESLWEVSGTFLEALDGLLAKDADQITPQGIVNHFAEAGVGDLLPPWSAEDRNTATKDGKIPVFTTWRSRLAAKQIGLDALMNLSALCSFATDQKALDDRVRGLI